MISYYIVIVGLSRDLENIPLESKGWKKLMELKI